MTTGETVDELAREHGARLLRVAYLVCRDRARAEDLVQEALLKAVRRWARAQPPEHAFAYLRATVVNEYLGWRRRRASTEVVTDLRGAEAGADPASDHATTQAERDAMWALLGSLPDRSRAVLVLRYYEDLGDREIADVLGCAEATVRSLASRAFASLRAHPDLADRADRARQPEEA